MRFVSAVDLCRMRPRFLRGLGLLFQLALLACLGWRAAGESVTYSYDAVGRLIGADYGNGRSLAYLYDPAGNLLRKSIVAFVDSDNDGLPDAWEIAHFGDLSRDGNGDFDHDGMTDRAEYLAGTDPKDPAAVLRIVQIEADPIGVHVVWQTVPGKLYRVQYKDATEEPYWNDVPGDIAASDALADQDDFTPILGRQRFYRVILLN